MRLMATAGTNSLWGYDLIPSTAWAAKEPRLGIGAFTPRPKKLRKLSVNIEEGICSVVVTIRVPTQLVNRCFLIILHRKLPRLWLQLQIPVPSVSGFVL